MKKLPVRGNQSKSQFALRVSSGFNQGALITLSKKKSILGRSCKVSIPLEDERASREHAEIINVAGEFALKDLGSTNGTYLNNELVQGIRSLKAGDIIRIGNSVLHFESLKAKGVELSEKWKNATSVISRSHFSFEELAKVQPDKYRYLKKQAKKIKRYSIILHAYFLREAGFIYDLYNEVETASVKAFFSFQKAVRKMKLLK